MNDQKEIVKRINKIRDYFSNNVTNNNKFIPEFDASNKISNIINGKENLTETDLNTIINIFNEVCQHDHYNGSGWQDYQIHIISLIRNAGLNCHTNNNGTITIKGKTE